MNLLARLGVVRVKLSTNYTPQGHKDYVLHQLISYFWKRN
nr:MAG TPA: hypothetical protein [Caudoviricetes sp.]